MCYNKQYIALNEMHVTLITRHKNMFNKYLVDFTQLTFIYINVIVRIAYLELCIVIFKILH